jgi:hypothetical protein
LESSEFASESCGRLLSGTAHVFDMALVVALGEIAIVAEFILDLLEGQSAAGGGFRPRHLGAMKNRPILGTRQIRSGRLRGLLPRDSHGSGHAGFPHPALRFTVSLRDDCRTDVRFRQRVTCQKPHHHIPRYPSPLRAATQPLAPHRNDSVAEVAQRLKVSGDTEIRKVPQQLPSQCCPLLRNRFVPVSLTHPKTLCQPLFRHCARNATNHWKISHLCSRHPFSWGRPNSRVTRGHSVVLISTLSS